MNRSRPGSRACGLFLAGLFLVLGGHQSALAAQGVAVEAVTGMLREIYRDLGDDLDIEILPTRHDLEQCEDPKPFLKNRRVNSSGRLFVGLDCDGVRYGTIYLPAQLTVRGQYVVARDHVPAGTVLDASMLELREGDITAILDRGIFELGDAVGRVAGRSLSPGVVVRQQFLEDIQLVERGAPVSFEVVGKGFRIAGSGEALQSGNPGDRVRIRTDQRKTLAGIVSPRGVVVVRP